MTTTPPLVKINVDSAEKISELYGVGPKLATKIVEYREAHGFFHGPTDLDKVEGISMSLALTLSPHIDWSFPVVSATFEKPKLAEVIAIGIIMFMITAYFLPEVIGLFTLPEGPFNRAKNDQILKGGLSALYILLGNSVLLGLSVFELSNDAALRQRIARFIYRSVIVWLILFSVRSIFMLLHEDLITSEGRRIFFANKVYLLSLVNQMFVYVMISPILVGARSPRHLKSEVLQRAYDIALLGLILILNYLLWTLRIPQQPVVMYLVTAVVMAWVIWSTIDSYRHNQPNFLKLGELTSGNAHTERDNKWLRWIAIQLPDVEQQRELQQALARAYPKSRFRTILSFAIISAGGWLLLTSIGAVVEWIIQKGMDKFTQ